MARRHAHLVKGTSPKNIRTFKNLAHAIWSLGAP